MYDYVIVGGGSAGCALAARLSEMPDAKVLLLESGPADTSSYIHMPVGFFKIMSGPLTWGYATSPKAFEGRSMIFPQARVLGGGSSINAMVFTRGHPLDYDTWAGEEGCQGWSFADILPYFRRSEDNERLSDGYHGTGGPLGVSDPISPHPLSRAFVRAAQEAGMPYNPDFNGARQEGCGLYQTTTRGGRRCSAAVGYLRPVMKRPNLDVRSDCHATRIIIEGNRAVGVEYRRHGREETVRAESEVIVSSGAVGSPRLLLLSGIGPADELKGVGVTPVHDLPGVGRNLQDHIDVYSIHKLNGPHSYDRHTRPHRMLWSWLQYRTFGNGPVTSNLAEAGGFWWADGDQPHPDIQFHFLPGAGIEAGVPPVDGFGCTINSCHLRPRSRGWVKLRSDDPMVPPEVDPNYWAEDYDLECSLRGFEMTREIAAQPALQKYIAREHLPGAPVKSRDELRAYARRFGKTDYHPAGSCKMGVDEMAVVDPQCRVRGIDGLRVADSSIMPRLVSSNTNAPSIMIGEKASDLIKGNRAEPLAA